jgi:hypothetical protein
MVPAWARPRRRTDFTGATVTADGYWNVAGDGVQIRIAKVRRVLALLWKIGAAEGGRHEHAN